MNSSKKSILIYKRSPLTLIYLVIKRFIFSIIKSKSSIKKPIAIFNKGYVSERIISEGIWSPEISSLIIKFSKLGFQDFFIDIGTNIGAITMEVSNYFKKNICFEPVDYNFQLAKYNLFHLKNIHLYKVGISDKCSTSKIKIPFNDFGSASIVNEKKDKSITANDSIFINCELIDGYQLRNIMNELNIEEESFGVIKIDVEGQEVAVIKSLIQANLILNNIIITELDNLENFEILNLIISKYGAFSYYFLDYSARKNKFNYLISIFTGTSVELKPLSKNTKYPLELIIVSDKLKEKVF